VPGKSIGYFRLVEACDRAGCPVCAYLDEDSRRQILTLFDEHVTDVATRRRLRDAWGLCNWHTWLALDTRATATGVAIVYEDLLRVCHDRFQAASDAPADRRPGFLTRARRRLGGLVGRRPPPAARARAVAAYRERPRCTVCTTLRTTEAQCLDTVVDFADDPELERAYDRSAGLCVPHLVAATERGPATPGVETLVRRTLSKWQGLRGALEQFVAKHEYRNTTPFTAEEARA
jgi:hypothetical protein